MTVKELMERSGMTATGRAVAYIKDALREINMIHETHIKNQNIDINQDQRNYSFPNDAIKLLDIRVKNHLNSKDEYRSIPRLMYEPLEKDVD